ncbi:DUF1576 domain-containing protein [Acholeplasma palmae]|uniref:DUF1576 domain-containing protein n=1 Tax=Acholeplasma palmae TaxID=38986 RepID=UPI0006988958|nr:DUF1576 domain-containing protein [Alteracholeplasma palmae]
MNKKTLWLTIYFSFIVSFIVILLLEPIGDLFHNYFLILKSPSVLLTDYLSIAGLPATLLNVLITLIVNVIIIKALKQKFSSSVIMSLFTIVGFSFFGKNSFNFIPLYLGVYLYTKIHRLDMRDHILVLLLSSGLAPVVSFFSFGAGFHLAVGLILGILIGILIGYILPIFNKHSLKFHQGYSLYATGFSMGVLSMVLTGVLKSFHIPITIYNEISYDYHYFLLFTILILSLFLIILALILKPNLFSDYKKIIKSSGRLQSDFFKISSTPAGLFNMGIMGLISLLLCLGLQYFTPDHFYFRLSGPSFGAILTIIGFSCFGKHPLNTLPVIIGGLISMYLTPVEVTDGTIIALFFVTGLAPITGKFGIFAGLLAGFFHLMITPLALDFQGGFDLYNNGFAAGFVASIISSIFIALKKDVLKEEVF